MCIRDSYVYEGRSEMQGFLSLEAESLGVIYPHDEAYVAMHEAWAGIPRIHVCLEDKESLPEEVFKAALIHEAAHSVLHGSPEYYVVTVPENLAEEFYKRGFSREELLHIAYLLAVAIKDREVSELLTRLSYQKIMKTFADHMLKIEEIDQQIWKIASKESRTALIYLCHILKTLASLNSKPEKAIQNSAGFLPLKAREALSRIMEGIVGSKGSFYEKMIHALKQTLTAFNGLHP